jgi:predicted RNA binding protein YcfA (HicA-like mRNA interferase family)
MTVKVRDAIKALEDAGWRFERMGKGSHAIYKKPGVPNHISVPTGHRKGIDPGLWERLKKEAGIS